MAQSRYYSSVAQDTALSAAVTAGATSITVGSTAGFPASFPYTLVIEPDTAQQEIVSVTAAAGTTLTVTRGQDGTSAVGHDVGSVVQHGHSARDFAESRQHEDATTNVHGIADTSALVVTTDPRLSDARTPTTHSHSVSSLTDTGWTAFTPALTASTTNPVLGTGGSVTGFYKKVGRRVDWNINIVFGAGVTSTGTWQVGLPPQAPANFNRVLASGMSMNPWRGVAGRAPSATTLYVYLAGTWSGTGSDITLASTTIGEFGEEVRLSGTYEAAS